MNTAQQNQPLIMDAERRAVGLHATWEIAAITNHLIEFADQLAGDETYSDMTGKELVLRTLAVRVKDLNECLLALLDDPDEPIKRLHRRVLGSYPATALHS